MPLPQITGGMVNRRFDELSKDGPAKANQMFRFLRALLGWAMWRYAHDDGTPILPSNPCEILGKLKRWHRIERRDRHIEPTKLKAFMAALAHDSEDSPHRRAAKDLCAVLVLTGLREQEGCGLRWGDVDLEVRRITVRHTKNHRIHTLPIGPWLALRLCVRRMETGFSPFVFPANNSVGHLRNHRRDVLAIIRIAGVEFRLHDLRRTFASIVNHHLERSLSAYTIKRLLNHSTDGDVTAGYIQHSVESLREPMEMVERFVLRSAGILPTASVHLLSGKYELAPEAPPLARELRVNDPLATHAG
jgi:integrase